MVFNKSLSPLFSFNGETLDVVEEYTYLGLLIHKSGVARDFTPSKYCIRGAVFSRPLAKYCTGGGSISQAACEILYPLSIINT